MAMNITVAAFDVDNTLTVRDCVVPFMRSVAGIGRLTKLMLSDLGDTFHSVRRRDRDAVKSKFVECVFAGKDAREIEALGVQFASRLQTGGCVAMLPHVCVGIKNKDMSLFWCRPH